MPKEQDRKVIEQVKKNAKDSSTWLRLLYIVIVFISFEMAKTLLVAITVFQFLHTMVTNGQNEPLLKFSKSLTTFMSQCLRYLTYASDEKPFPFSDWPQS